MMKQRTWAHGKVLVFDLADGTEVKTPPSQARCLIVLLVVGIVIHHFWYWCRGIRRAKNPRRQWIADRSSACVDEYKGSPEGKKPDAMTRALLVRFCEPISDMPHASAL